MRSSKKRDLVCEIVNLSCSHPTAEEIYEMSRQQIPNISLGTVYRNLNTLGSPTLFSYCWKMAKFLLVIIGVQQMVTCMVDQQS